MFQILNVRGLWVLLLLNGYLLSPLLLFDAGLLPGLEIKLEPLLLFNLAASVLGLLLLHSLVEKPLLLHALLLPFYITTAIDLFLVVFYQSRLSASYLLILAGEMAELPEFLSSFTAPIALSVLALSAIWLGGLYGILDLHWRVPHRTRLALALLLICAYGVAAARQMHTYDYGVELAAYDILVHDRSAPAGILPQGYIAWKQYRQAREFLETRKTFRFDAQTDDPKDTIYVLVIGESARPDHWTLQGYRRNTTPRIAANNAVIWFPDVTTQSALTRVSVPAMLSLAPITEFDRILSEASILRAFSEVGLKSWWISTQEVSQFGGHIHVLAGEATTRKYFERQLDVALLNEVKQLLSGPASNGGLVIMHGRGSHFTFRNRYPREFAVWDDNLENQSRRDFLVNSYDNSLRYTDSILADTIELIENMEQPAVLLYVSDHGENLLDDERALFGHNIGTEQDLRTTQFFWASQSWRKRHPERWALIQSNANLPVSTAHIAHSLLEIAGIQAKGLDPAQSWAGSGFKATDRRPFRLNGKIHYFESQVIRSSVSSRAD
ncbi:phosphoethanolamine transferase [Microbulbifer marinus]|uniref:Heptose-I-phosphate ethanolaminephosphotransferase n=1 Tax=Microbulbifer marinus TaxID=658218 RepID=A0A1H3XEA4_9GAMM|nr:phosphoethanolamine transferase [Microbulbifer marinus]SDZ97663.1 heptose-I-phosphate ethanolaminephosphotransferase [Microbulbifer marinus]